ncbi:alpha/beta hydrolase [Deinococcus sp. Arct2-2]|uniref:alpha/beta hydrolase n=1 Tax=Deinococcus sp. Arct2-2 TaxID=2568653 RepID=UPI0010A3FC3B|nr:alpha/beta hydrolase [Deinococcus sp. Arct2-2]THF68968.1 alpha/beta hydrolase [Deinococcus sp. Arct2-2]
MNRMRPLFVLVLTSPALAVPQPITLKASDGVTVYGQHTAVSRPKGVLLLFHQADSNLHEYDPVAARLATEGYASLAIDQRVGGGMFGAENRTARAAPPADYAGALPDLEAALGWAKTTYPKTKIFALGSSYSAMLLFPLAARHPELAGILAFSPADYTGDGLAVRAASSLKVPVFATSRGDPAEREQMDVVLRAVRRAKVTRFQPVGGGLHGASSLRDDRNILGTAGQYWTALLKFLRAP